MKTLEESPFILGKSEWEPRSALPDMWQVVHQCESASLGTPQPEILVHWLIFLKEHKAATLEEFLREFDKGTKKKDFYEFSKYCSALYRKVHEKQLAEDMHPLKKNLIRKFMSGAEEMDKLGDEYHNPTDDYWQKSASIAGPDDRELPRSYMKLLSGYDSFEEFMEAHKEFDRTSENTRPAVVDERRKRTAKTIQTVLGK